MSRDEPSMEKPFGLLASGYLLYILLAPVLVFGLILLVLILGRSATPTTNSGGGAGRVEESGLESARQSLARQTDLLTCRSALQQINSELSQRSQQAPPSLTADENAWLRRHAGLDSGEIAEIEGGNYTRLDGEHLDACFLLRDVARALEVKGVRGAGGAAVREPALQQAADAFAWVVREVRQREHPEEPIPPAFVLRRGWGNAFERALVFLALLEQRGDLGSPRPELLGCLLLVPGKSGGLRFWACGVVVGDGKDVYLFDPRLGLPLPGPKGQGIATLAEARKQPEVLAQLHVEKLTYDVTAEQAREARVLLVRPLPSLAPRMRHLQDQLLAPVVGVRLAAYAPKDLERVQAASAGGADKPPPVELWKPGVGQLRRFLPPDEGGIDEGEAVQAGDPRRLRRTDRFALDLVPWSALPMQFQDQSRFPANIGLGQRVRTLFARPFILSAQDPGHARDLLLRGRYSTVVPELVREREHWRDEQKRRANAGDLSQRADEWVEKAIRAYAAQLRAETPPQREEAERRVRALWSESQGEPIYLLLNNAIAQARIPEVTYLLGLCNQEQAEQLQARVDLQASAPGATPHPADVEKARQAWQDALNTWKQYNEDYPDRGDRAAARRMRGRAESLLGDRPSAVSSWRDLSGEMTELEKLAALYQAQKVN
jgi:hypothetical protein